MKQINNIIQGSESWHKHRAEHFNASDAPAMMGVSPYKSRSEFLRERATGATQEINAYTQKIFNGGHRYEALARPLAEKIIGGDLYPITGTAGKLSASFDGITLDESIIFEHKTLNNKLRGITDSQDLPDYIRIQMEQQLYVSGAEECLFMASKWDGNNELIEEMHLRYFPDLELRKDIIEGWTQFAIDLENYEHVDIVLPVTAETQMDLPEVSINVKGEIALIDNLDAFSEALKLYINDINTKPETDQDFANLESSVKTLKKAENALLASEADALAQAESIDTMRRKVAFNHDLARSNRLLIEKLVKSEKENRRNAILQDARNKLEEHFNKLDERLGWSYMPAANADFINAMKGKRTISSLQDAADTELANAKIKANEIADKIEINLNTLKEKASDYKFLFADTSDLIMKSNDDLNAVISMRIHEHKESESKKLEAEREALQRKEAEASEAAKRRENELKLAAEKSERERIEAEERAVNAARETEERLKHEADAKSESESKEQDNREANKKHVFRINNESIQCLADNGLTKKQAKEIIELIAENKIKHVSIKY